MKKYFALLYAFILISNYSFSEDWNNPNAVKSYSDKPLLFVENKGQVADKDGNIKPDIKFTAEGNGVKLFFSGDGIYYQFEKSKSSACSILNQKIPGSAILKEKKAPSEIYRLDMKLVNANPNANIKKAEISKYHENFYLAHCPQGITGVESFSKIIYENIYPKIDWVIYSNGNNLEYDFIVHPGGNPKSIKIAYNFAEKIVIEKNGSAKIITSQGEIVEAAPLCLISENKKGVAAKFSLNEHTLQFDIEKYDAAQTLIIDPVLLWSTYYGGTSYDYAYGCSTDTSGNVFVTGESDSNNGIATSGGFQSSHVAFSDGFIAKFDENGTRLWATYFGASDDDFITSSTCDKLGNIFIAGYTASTLGISSGGFQNSFGGGLFDAFFAKFSNSGTRIWSSYYGGLADDVAYNCAVDLANNFYLTGTTVSNNGIAAGIGTQGNNPGGNTCFLAKFTSNGTRIWGTFFGDGGDERAYSCATDKLGNVYMAGYANGSQFMGIGGFQNSPQGSFDGILVKFNSLGSVIWSTYYGGWDSDIGLACATDNSNNVFLAGKTNSSFSIASSGFQNSFGGGTFDGFVVKFDELGARLWATYIGNVGEDYVQECIADELGNAIVCGSTSSTTAIHFNGFQTSYGGGTQDAFVMGFGPTGNRFFGSYLGGSSEEYGNDCTLDKLNNIYVAGQTSSANFNTIGTIHQATLGGGIHDAFISKIENPCIASSANINFTGTAYACSSNTLLLQATTGTGYNYQWQLNGAPIVGAINATFSASHGGNYALVVNQNGVCQDTSAILFVDSVPPAVPLCICTVDSLSKYNLLVWEKPASTIIDSFRIYREDITNVFSYVKSIDYSEYSVFIDSNLLYANPNVTSKLYKIASVDVCGVESPMSPFHHTIKLNDQSNGNFDWNFYEIQGQVTPILQYILLRDSISIGSWSPIAITSGNVNQVTDPDYNLYPNARYRIVTNLGSLNCTPTMRVLSGFNSTRSNIKNKAVGIKEEANSNKIKIYPNPSNVSLTIVSDIVLQEINILDLTGREVLTKKFDHFNLGSHSINISNLAAGSYLISFRGKDFAVKKLFVIE